jgi:hypothetical protein
MRSVRFRLTYAPTHVKNPTQKKTGQNVHIPSTYSGGNWREGKTELNRSIGLFRRLLIFGKQLQLIEAILDHLEGTFEKSRAIDEQSPIGLLAAAQTAATELIISGWRCCFGQSCFNLIR